jgi:hypothetical protein
VTVRDSGSQRATACRLSFAEVFGSTSSQTKDYRASLHIFMSRDEAATLRFGIEPDMAIAESYGFNSRELADILKTIGANRELILRAWHDHLGD